MRERRPTVIEEVRRSLFFATTLWEVEPELLEEVERTTGWREDTNDWDKLTDTGSLAYAPRSAGHPRDRRHHHSHDTFPP